MKRTITLIGAGNVGYHLGRRLFECGHVIHQVFSRTLNKAKDLALQTDAKAVVEFADIDNQADIYIIAIKDDAIKPVAKTLAKLLGEDKIIVHTSGATPSSVFKDYFKHYGIFYPLQTLSKNYQADFSNIPFCIDGNGKEVLAHLLDLAQSIAPNVYTINDQQRQILHVAAIFVNNFTNHLFSIGEDILEKEGLSFDILKPLAFETVRKLERGKAADMQTGPAIRGDEVTIERHLAYLNKHPDYQNIYAILTERIKENR